MCYKGKNYKKKKKYRIHFIYLSYHLFYEMSFMNWDLFFPPKEKT